MPVATIDPTRTRAAIAGGEALFGAGLVCPEGIAAVRELGVPVDVRSINFVTRTAPMGPVPAEVAIAVFYNFNPVAVRAIIPTAWEAASPRTILDEHQRAFAPPLAAALATLDRDLLADFARLLRAAAEAAREQLEGRALFAAFTARPWPEGDHLVAWHAAKLLREHRGDGHVAALVAADLAGIEALIVHEAFDSRLPPGVLRRSRGWSRDQWTAAVGRLRERGWLTPTTDIDDGRVTLSETGRARRQSIEDLTSELAAVAFEPIGAEGVDRLVAYGPVVAKALHRSGLSLSALFAGMAERPSNGAAALG